MENGVGLREMLNVVVIVPSKIEILLIFGYLDRRELLIAHNCHTKQYIHLPHDVIQFRPN